METLIGSIIIMQSEVYHLPKWFCVDFQGFKELPSQGKAIKSS